MPTANLTPRNYVAGHFNCAISLNSVSSSGGATWINVGSTRDGWHKHTSFHVQPVHDDAYGDGKSDTIGQGTDMSVEGVIVQAKAFEASGIIWNLSGGEGQSNNQVGLRGSDIYGSMALTPIAGTPAAAQLGAGNSVLFYLADIINDVSIPLSAKLKEFPVTFDILPDPNHTNLFYAVVATSTLSGVSAVPIP